MRVWKKLKFWREWTNLQLECRFVRNSEPEEWLDAGVSPKHGQGLAFSAGGELCGSFLQPHYRNFNKRITKAPKLYFYDTGLACSLLGLESRAQLSTHYLKGNLFENFVVNEFLKMRFNAGQRSNLYCWQSKEKKEIDLIVDQGGQLQPFEIKSSMTKTDNLFENLWYWKKLSGTPYENLNVVYGGLDDFKTSKGNFISWKSLEGFDFVAL